MMRPASARQRFRCTFSKEALNAPPFASNSVKVEFVGARTSDDHEIDSRWQQVVPKAEAFATYSLDSIASHGDPNLAGHYETQSGRAERRS